jgi:hypothetical protein
LNPCGVAGRLSAKQGKQQHPFAPNVKAASSGASVCTAVTTRLRFPASYRSVGFVSRQ